MARGAKDYPVPDFLIEAGIQQETYGRWLDRITNAHVGRDRDRLGAEIKPAIYRKAIHEAVQRCKGKDAYTGQPLDFRLLEFIAGAPVLGRDETLVPTLDHVVLNPLHPRFEFCSLRTNKCKADLTAEELLDFARAIVTYSGETKDTPTNH